MKQTKQHMGYNPRLMMLSKWELWLSMWRSGAGCIILPSGSRWPFLVQFFNVPQEFWEILGGSQCNWISLTFSMNYLSPKLPPVWGVVWWSLLLLSPLSLSSWSLFSLSLSLSSSPLVWCPIWQVVLWRLTLNSIFVAREPRKADTRQCQVHVFRLFHVYPDIHININIETHV